MRRTWYEIKTTVIRISQPRKRAAADTTCFSVDGPFRGGKGGRGVNTLMPCWPHCDITVVRYGWRGIVLAVLLPVPQVLRYRLFHHVLVLLLVDLRALVGVRRRGPVRVSALGHCPETTTGSPGEKTIWTPSGTTLVRVPCRTCIYRARRSHQTLVNGFIIQVLLPDRSR